MQMQSVWSAARMVRRWCCWKLWESKRLTVFIGSSCTFPCTFLIPRRVGWFSRNGDLHFQGTKCASISKSHTQHFLQTVPIEGLVFVCVFAALHRRLMIGGSMVLFLGSVGLYVIVFQPSLQQSMGIYGSLYSKYQQKASISRWP